MENLKNRGLTLNQASAVVTLPGGGALHSTGATTNCVIDGRFATGVTAITTAGLPATDAVTGVAFVAMAANRATILVFGQPLAGGSPLLVAQGSVEVTAPGVGAVAGAFITHPQLPSLPDNFCPLAYVVVRTAPDAAAWTAGTSNWNATGVTTGTVRNVHTLPRRPLVS